MGVGVVLENGSRKAGEILVPCATTVVLCLELMCQSDFQPFPSHATHKLMTKILGHTKKYRFCPSGNKNRYNFDSFTLEVVLALVMFLFDGLRERGPCP